MNAIFNASFHGVSLKDTTMYVWGLPVCNECAKGIIQVGINRIVMAADDVPQRWIESYDKSKQLFIEAGCKFETDFRLAK
jgi:dCMP deaminase